MEDFNSVQDTPWFPFIQKIRTLVVEEGITVIGNYAFNKFQLNDITFPESLVSIGQYAFADLSGAKSITLPPKLKTVGPSAFHNSSIDNVYISDLEAYLKIGFADVFANPIYYNYSGTDKVKKLYLNKQLVTSVVIPEGITLIPKGAFAFCDDITSVTIPESVTKIKEGAFKSCKGLTSVTIPDSVRVIEGSAFHFCTSLTDIELGKGIETIGANAFSSCTALDKVYISDMNAYLNIATENNTSMPLYFADKLYLNDRRVTNLDIPEGVTKINPYALACDSLKSVTVPEGVTDIGAYAFKGNAQLKKAEIPKSVTNIGAGIFSDCTALEEVSLPFIGASAENNRTDTSVLGYLFSGGAGFSVVGGTKIFYDEDKYKCYTGRPEALGKVTLTNAVQIPYGAFSTFDTITEITIPEGVAAIDEKAFEGCSTLKTLNFNAENCTSSKSNLAVFEQLNNVNIGNSVRRIPSNLFNGCTCFETIDFGESLLSIDENALADCTGLKKCVLPVTVSEIEQSAFKGCSALAEVDYEGDEADWENIFIASGNECLENAKINFLGAEPTPTPSASPSVKPTVTPPAGDASPSPSATAEPKNRIEFKKNGESVEAKLILGSDGEDICVLVAYRDGEKVTSVSIPELTDDMTASFEYSDRDMRVYVWNKRMKPIMDVQSVILK